jgi:tetratricopeptide (TPR) repeat protein
MVDRKPDLAAYSRVSYFRELHGDLPGAVRAMRLAVSAGGAVPEQDAYVRSLLGGLELQRGRIDAALRAYRAALTAVPRYPAAEAGLAQADVARGRLRPAIARLERVVARLPLAAYIVALGEAQAAAGERAAATQSFALARAEAMLQQRAGVNGDVELAVFEADHGSARRAVVLARRAWADAPSVRSADALGWALHRAGHSRAALGWARRALALGSRDPAFLAHAGLIARAAGEPERAARWLAGARTGRAALGARLREAVAR